MAHWRKESRHQQPLADVVNSFKSNAVVFNRNIKKTYSLDQNEYNSKSNIMAVIDITKLG